jgi:hypothetical protein
LHAYTKQEGPEGNRDARRSNEAVDRLVKKTYRLLGAVVKIKLIITITL